MEGPRGFAEAFDRLANANTSVFVVEVSAHCRRRTPVDQVRDQLFQAMRNSDSRVRIVFVHRFHSDFHSTFTLQITVVTSKTGPILVFPRIQPFK